MEEHEIVLSDIEKTLLKPYITALEKWEVYDYSEVVAILNNIEIKENQNIISWKETMMKTMQNGNEEMYKKLVNQISL